VTPETIRHVARLARLELTPDEEARLTSELQAIIGFVEQLEAVPTEGVAPMVHAIELTNVLRDDVPRPSLPPDEALGNAPDREGDFYRVPRVVEGGNA
jgi:aspartyl-tRNA(Asn)/glutamyl-tRNA(Gln) amidotransferase subunit C